MTWLFFEIIFHIIPTLQIVDSIYIKFKNNKCWKGYREKGTLLYCWWECKLVQPVLKTVWSFLKKLKIELSYDSAIPLLGIYQKKKKIKNTNSKKYTHPNIHSSIIYNYQDMETTVSINK